MPRRALWWSGGAAALVVVLIVGLSQAPESKGPSSSGTSPLSRSEIEAKLAGAPPALAALHREANAFLPGEGKGLRARLRELRGHPVVVNVWAAWCGPCRDELPVFQRASLDWGTRVGFLGIDLDDNRGDARRVLEKIPLTYPSYEDPNGRIATGYKLVGTPSTIFYDADGKQVAIHQGPYLERADLDADIERYALGRT
jgi:cytochrome c biogenesis protein CcmG/thiol:disulfide interchange protein DsbE